MIFFGLLLGERESLVELFTVGGERQKMTHAKPNMTLLILLIEDSPGT